MTEKKFPEGHFISKGMAIGIAIGAGLGVPLSIALGSPGLMTFGLPIGLTIGVAMGTSWENKAKEKGQIRPLTDDEKKKKKIALYMGICTMIIGMIVIAAILIAR